MLWNSCYIQEDGITCQVVVSAVEQTRAGAGEQTGGRNAAVFGVSGAGQSEY